MKKSLLPKVVTFAVIASLLALSYQQTRADGDPEPQPAHPFLAACVVIFAGVMVVGTAVVIRNCKPKYWCLKDKEGTHWVGTATKKECQISGWTVVGGPYESVAAGTNNCPPPATNSVTMNIPAPDSFLQLQESTNLIHWTTIQEQWDDASKFKFEHTNTMDRAAYYRVLIAP
jgi:hypothetical protein